MHLHLAVEALGCRHSGAATVLCDLISTVIRDSRFGRVTVLSSHKNERRFCLPASDKIRDVDVPQTQISLVHRLHWLRKGLPDLMEKLGADVLISLSGTGRGTRGRPHVPFIQQSLPFSREASTKLMLRDRIRQTAIYYMMRSACFTGAAVLVQTNTMRNAVISAFEIPHERVRVVSYAVREPEKQEGYAVQVEEMRRTKPGCRLLYVGNDAPYKNVGTLLAAVDAAARDLPDVRLFITWPADHPAGSNEHVKCLGYLDEAAVSEAYRLADVLVMPSLTETVGLPLLEAMTAGTPVLAADRPYAHEICEDAADFFDPLDALSLSAGISKLLRDDARRRELSRLGLSLSLRQRSHHPYQRMLDAAAEVARRSC